MADEREVLRAGEYSLAVQGLAMLRALARPSLGRVRVEEMRAIVERIGEFPHSLEFPVTEYDVESGYSQWAPLYDGPNYAITCEEPIVASIVASLPPGDALDAACGTGRHCALLAKHGHRVIGVDATQAMLDIARTKVPGDDLRRGMLDELPLDDASVDLVTCALALEHVADLGPVFREFARVLRPGGQAILSDIHPSWKVLGGVAAFPTADGSPGVPYVAGHIHHFGDYASAFLGAGFTLRGCFDARIDEEGVQTLPSYRLYPEATRQAFVGIPFVLVLHLER